MDLEGTGTDKDDNKQIASASVQCNETTKAGARCKNKTHNESGYCYLHESQATNGSSKIESTNKPIQTTKSTSSFQVDRHLQVLEVINIIIVALAKRSIQRRNTDFTYRNPQSWGFYRDYRPYCNVK